jgi:acyl dehydratase
MPPEEMSLDRSYIGKEYHSSPQVAAKDAMMKYAKATNETNHRYYDEESSEGVFAPPLFSVSFLPDLLAQMVDDAEDMNLDILRVVHAEHEIWWKERIHPGDQILAKTKIVNIEKRGVNELLDMYIHIMREETVLVEMRYRLMMRGKKKGEKKERDVQDVAAEKSEKIAQKTVHVTKDQGLRYAEASGDHNPIHISDEIAQAVGLPSAILQGLCTMAFASQTIVDELLDGDPTRLRYMKVRFSKPVLMEQDLTTEVFDAGEQDGGLQSVQFETKNQEGFSVITNGLAEFVIYP